MIIVQNEVLFKILNEFKETLNFDILNNKDENLNDSKFNNSSDFLIISNETRDSDKRTIVLKNLPIKLKKLIQLINIQFLKNKFNFQSDIQIGRYIMNINSREMIRKDKKLNLTEREMNLIIFLSQSKSPVRIDKLQKEVWDYNSELETHTVETHIYRLRKKIMDKFKDDNFIISLKNGYKIN